MKASWFDSSFLGSEMFPEGMCNMVHGGADCVRCKAIKSFKGKTALLDCAGKAAKDSMLLEAIKLARNGSAMPTLRR
jgi:hypothetical protein